MGQRVKLKKSNNTKGYAIKRRDNYSKAKKQENKQENKQGDKRGKKRKKKGK